MDAAGDKQESIYRELIDTLHNYIIEKVNESVNEQKQMKYGRDKDGVYLIEDSISPELYAKIKTAFL